ncbi:MAG: hypothetical protein HRT37_25325 [Alteromonadaceae bacterium]|nr:hypothetical protein [Alteromonadaceae bacterium]
MCSTVSLFLSDEQMDELLAYAKERRVDLITAVYELIDSNFKSKALPTAIKRPFEVSESIYSSH